MMISPPFVNEKKVLACFYDFLLKIKVARFWVPMYPTIQIVYNFVLNITIKANRLLIFLCSLFLLIFLVCNWFIMLKWTILVEVIPQMKWNFVIRTDYQNSIHRISIDQSVVHKILNIWIKLVWFEEALEVNLKNTKIKSYFLAGN